MSPFSHGVFIVFVVICLLNLVTGTVFNLSPDGHGVANGYTFYSVLTSKRQTLMSPLTSVRIAKRTVTAGGGDDGVSFAQSLLQPAANRRTQLVQREFLSGGQRLSSPGLQKRRKRYVAAETHVQRTSNDIIGTSNLFPQLLKALLNRIQKRDFSSAGKSDRIVGSREIHVQWFKTSKNGSFKQMIYLLKGFRRLRRKRSPKSSLQLQSHALTENTTASAFLSGENNSAAAPVNFNKSLGLSKRKIKIKIRRSQKTAHKTSKKKPVLSELYAEAVNGSSATDVGDGAKYASGQDTAPGNKVLSPHQEVDGRNQDGSGVLSPEQPVHPVELQGQESEQLPSDTLSSLVTKKPEAALNGTTTYLGLDGKPVNMTEFIKFLEEKEFQRILNREAQWAYMCLVTLICLMMLAMWCLGGLRRCRYRGFTVSDNFSESQFLMSVYEVVGNSQQYLPGEPDWEEVLVADRGSDP